MLWALKYLASLQNNSLRSVFMRSSACVSVVSCMPWQANSCQEGLASPWKPSDITALRYRATSWFTICRPLSLKSCQIGFLFQKAAQYSETHEKKTIFLFLQSYFFGWYCTKKSKWIVGYRFFVNLNNNRKNIFFNIPSLPDVFCRRKLDLLPQKKSLDLAHYKSMIGLIFAMSWELSMKKI